MRHFPQRDDACRTGSEESTVLDVYDESDHRHVVARIYSDELNKLEEHLRYATGQVFY